MKTVALSAAMGALFLAGVASAQVYYPPTYTAPTYTTPISGSACVILTSDLSFGSRGTEVTKLQQFLVSQNYPGGGSWMITGYFGNATVQAVRNFQQSAGIPMTGYVDATTRAAIQSRTCLSGQGGILGTAYPQANIAPTYPLPTPTYPITTPTYAPTTPTYPFTTPTYPLTTPSYPYPPYQFGSVSITSLSSYSAQIGTSITIYGFGFDAYSTNTVHVGSATVVASSNGTSLTFTVPSLPPGTYSVYVTNSRGTSNSLSLSVTQVQSVCNPLPWYQGWQWGQTQYQCGVYSNVVLNSLSPNWAAVGTTITVKGNGFSATGNTVYMGGSVVATVSSTNNGTELTFTVPQQLQGPYGLQQIVPGHYPVRVVNGTGAQSNSLTLSITEGTTSLSISNVSGPTSLAAGSVGTWTLNVTAPYGSYLTTSVNWGDSSTPSTSSVVPAYLFGTQTLTLTHVYANAGTFTINFNVSSANNTTSATRTVTVTSAPSGGPLMLNTLSPMQGAVGTTVTLNGSGFTSTDNVVHFGIGGSRNVPSTNSGTQIAYLIPTYISACDLIQPGYFCGAPTQTVTPGVYPVYVTNSVGATNVLYFTVQ
ncbi:IPT/TIG domain-containing protein [Candidatus Kaiserbacteria bacterium]|nr:IPT/TIG domain-containing protein [Candidatus Kaiserbacteria bacterium]